MCVLTLLACSPDVKLPSPTDLIDTVRDIVKELGLTLVIEPGRSMVATSSALVNTVTGGLHGCCAWVLAEVGVGVADAGSGLGQLVAMEHGGFLPPETMLFCKSALWIWEEWKGTGTMHQGLGVFFSHLMQTLAVVLHMAPNCRRCEDQREQELHRDRRLYGHSDPPLTVRCIPAH